MNYIIIIALIFSAYTIADPVELPIQQPVYKLIDMQPKAEIPSKYYYIVAKNCYKYHIALWLAGRLMYEESEGNPYATNTNKDSSFDGGLWQLNSKYFSFVNPYDVERSTTVAMAYLHELIVKTGSLQGGVAAYNCGLNRVLKNKIPLETQAYVKRIFKQ